jgi:hypothetical protein
MAGACPVVIDSFEWRQAFVVMAIAGSSGIIIPAQFP